MSFSRTLPLVLTAGLLALWLGGCEEKGPAERAGEKIDKAVEDAGEAIEDTRDKLKDDVGK